MSLRQTLPPTEIVIVDAGDSVADNHSRIQAVLAGSPRPATPLIYLASPIRSSSAQRNLAIDVAVGDVLFLFDDDTLMFPDCAETILRAYASDPERRIAAAGAVHVAQMPMDVSLDADRKDTRRNQSEAAPDLREPSRREKWLRGIRHWIWTEVFLMNASRLFIQYDTPRLRGNEAAVAALGVARISHQPLISGYAMTVRREVARTERFDPILLSYSPGEDMDATYRFSRHGLNVAVEGALVHHFEAASGRIKRKQATTLGLMNVASFVANKSSSPARDIPAYYLMFVRRLFAEFCKDLLSRRFTFPQFAGTVLALPRSIGIFRHRNRADFDGWYKQQQLDILKPGHRADA
ncbi:hypothetical protein VW29_13430 [Devosia limi DSM 17137]|uniref:Glycosyltransferase 2-like domain-containing protein n=1 Tax=Devosia limi DSM 17137 TaxID=1121477 RepID=A0A0F5LNL2_9HYPH|nr:hypothetical protein VW29_13430 [Devosia limi DSM 17137]